jgi:hypothetical protein
MGVNTNFLIVFNALHFLEARTTLDELGRKLLLPYKMSLALRGEGDTDNDFDFWISVGSLKNTLPSEIAVAMRAVPAFARRPPHHPPPMLCVTRDNEEPGRWRLIDWTTHTDTDD